MTRRRWLTTALLGWAAAGCLDGATPPLLRSPIASLEIQATDSFLLVGHERQLQVVARDSSGQPVSAATVVWGTISPLALLVDNTGLTMALDSSPGGSHAVLVTDTAGTAADTFGMRVVRHGEVKWRLSLGFMPLLGGPAQGPDGTVYVLGAVDTMIYDATLYAVSPAGALRWQRRLTQVDYGNYPVVGPDGTVFVVGQYIYAYAPDGALRWSLTTRPVEQVPNLPDGHSAALGSDGTLYAALGKDLLALEAATGDTIWEGPRAADGGWLLPPTVSVDGRTAYIKNTGDSLYAFDAGAGTRRWAAPDPYVNQIVFGVGAALTDARIILPVFDRLQELDTTGAPVGLSSTNGHGFSEPVVDSTGKVFSVQSNPPGVRAYRPITTTLWTAPPRSRWTWFGGPALAVGGTLYVAAYDAFYAYQVSGTGAIVRWRYPADSTVRLTFVGAPAIGPDGTVYTFTSCDFGREPEPCSDELIAFWEDKPVDPNSPWPMWRHDARRSGQAHK